MKKIILSLCFMVATATLFAQKADEVAKFKTEKIDFGKIQFDNPTTATFVVKNIGSTPLIIETATPTCGCTIGDYTKSPIAPGKEGWIKATYTAKSLGAFDKVMTVKFAGIPETKTIAIKGEVLSKADYAKVKPAGKVEVKSKSDATKTKTVIKSDGKKTTKTKVKAPVKSAA